MVKEHEATNAYQNKLYSHKLQRIWLMWVQPKYIEQTPPQYMHMCDVYKRFYSCRQCNIPRFYQILEWNFYFYFVVLIEISQVFKTFWVYLKALL
jgi:hypothetical protein